MTTMSREAPVSWSVVVNLSLGLNEVTKQQAVALGESLATDSRVTEPIISSSGERVGMVAVIEDPRPGFAIEQAISACFDSLDAAGFRVDPPRWRVEIEAEPVFADGSADG